MSKNKTGICHICLKKSKLTADHVPPKSCKNKGKQQLFLEYIITEKNTAITKTKLFQNGIKFYTICQKCNNDLLGGDYDRELEYFMKEVESQIHTGKKFSIISKWY